MPFATASSKRKSDRKKARKSRIRQSKRAYLFESLEERLNLSLMFMEMEPNEDTTSPVNFAGDLLAAQAIALPGASTGIVDSATMAQVIGDSPTDNDENPDYYTFNAAVNGEIHITVMNRGGDPGGDGGADNLDVRVFRENPVNVDDAINLPNALANTLPVGKFYTGTFSATAGEKFFVRVSGDAGDDDANYELRIWNSEASDNVVPNNNSQLNAEPLGIVDGTTAIATSGTITQADRDFYRFGAGADGRVSVRITMPEGTGYTFGPEGKEPTNLGVRVRDASGMIIATSNGTAGNVDIASFEATDTNTYFAEIYSSSFGQINAYDLDISMVGDPTGRITGYVFQDDNLNTFRDPTEDLLDGYNVSIDIGNDGATTVDTTLTTDANGYYSFENVPFGTHRVYITPQSGFHAEYPDEPNRAEYTIQISEDNLNMDHTDFALGEADFGDAPDTYGTFLASDGARHANRGPALGKFRDAESNARTPLDGTGDDIGINSAVDLSFNPGAGTNGRVDFVALQADGKALIGGTFTTVDGVSRNNIARLNPDGSLDNTFTPGTGTNGPVLSVALQADGRILIAGDFTAVNGVLRNDIARLNSDGSVDTTFNPGSGTNGSIASDSLLVLSGGKIVIGGQFTQYNGVARNNIARLNSDGSLDTTFNPGTGTDARVRSIAVQTDGKLVIGGDFANVNGVARNDIARLDANGSVDTTFNPGTGTDGFVHVVALQDDGKVLIGGGFSAVNGVVREDIARLNADGSVDTTFMPDLVGSTVGSIALMPGGKIVIGGAFSTVSGVARNDIARLNPNGSLDTTFAPGTGTNGFVNNLTVGPDGRVLVGGSFTTVDGVGRNNIARLNQLEDDEDGVTFTRPIIQGTNATVDVVSSGNGLLNAWIDFNRNGSFEVAERIFTNRPVTAGTNNLTYPVPGTVTAGPSYARFRLSTAADLTPSGPAPDGEVEDYAVDVFENTVSISNVSMSEGNVGPKTFSFTVTLSAASASDISFNFATADGGSGEAENEAGDNDYRSTTGSRTFSSALGETTKTIDVTVNGDTVGEPDERFFVNLSALTGPAAFSNSVGVGTILNDDSGISIVAVDADLTEGDLLDGDKQFTFRVNRSGDTSGSTNVTWSVAGIAPNAANASDFSAPTSGTVTFNPTDTSKLFSVRVRGDNDVEPDETFRVTLTGATGGAVIVGATADGIIRNDDIDLAIATTVDSDKAEGNTLSAPATDFKFQVTRTGDTSGVTTVQYTVTGGPTNPADAADFSSGVFGATGLVTFPASSSASQTITIPVNGDTVAEPDETFTVTLSNPSIHAEINTTTATGTIRNDDIAFNIAPPSAVKPEGNTGNSPSTPYTFTVTRTKASVASSVNYSVAGSGPSPADASDFVGATSGTVNFAPDDESKTVTINVNGDTMVEADDQFTVKLDTPINGTIVTGTADGTIQNDDSGIQVALLAPTSQAEGNTGDADKLYQFVVSRSGSSGAVSVQYTVAGIGTNAANAGDFSAPLPTNLTLNWADGESDSKYITVFVKGDNDVEPDETFALTLSNPVGASASLTPVTATIVNDDADLAIAPMTLTSANKLEGDGGTNPFTFTVTRTGDLSGPVTVRYDVLGSGTNPADPTDFVGSVFPTNGLASFAASDQTAMITIPVNGDLTAELDEGFTVTLSNVTGNAEIATATADGTIQNDDSASLISISTPVSMNEGDTGVTPAFNFTVSRTGDISAAASVFYTVSGGTTNPADAADFKDGVFPSGTFMFAPNEGSKTLPILVNGDDSIEAAEEFVVTLSNPLPQPATGLGTFVAKGTILNDDGDGQIFGTKRSGSITGTPLPGVTFELFNDNGAFPGVFNPASPFDPNQAGVDTLQQVAVTDENGKYRFGAALPAGTYYIREVPRAGWGQINPIPPTTFAKVVYDGINNVDVDMRDEDNNSVADGPFVNARCSDNQFETSANLGQVIKATRPGILTIEVVGDPGVSFVVKSSSGNVMGLNPSLVRVAETAAGFASRGSGNRARVDLVLTQADINANTTFSISMVNNGGASPTLLVANSVLVDGSGVLNIEGSSCGDVIVVRDDPNSGGRNDSDAKSIFVGSYTGRLTDINDANNLAGKFPGVTYNAAIMNASFGPVVIAEIRITAGDGNDIVRIGDGGGLYKGVTQNSTIDGGNGDDVLRAGAGRSTIYGRDGSDFIVGGSDNDVIYGGNGDDYIDGQAGLDRIFGDDGNDWLSGGDGDDPLIRGGAGNDTLSGGPGKDRLLGDSGMDTAYQEKNGTTSVDIFVSATNVIPVATAALPDPCQDKLNKLVDRFWTNDQNSSDGLDTLDEIISTLLP